MPLAFDAAGFKFVFCWSRNGMWYLNKWTNANRLAIREFHWWHRRKKKITNTKQIWRSARGLAAILLRNHDPKKKNEQASLAFHKQEHQAFRQGEKGHDGCCFQSMGALVHEISWKDELEIIQWGEKINFITFACNCRQNNTAWLFYISRN